jgi:hypothetical protein
MDKQTRWKLWAIVILMIIGIAGWFMPLIPAQIHAPPTGHLPLDGMFRSAGVVLWRLVPFAIVLQIFKSSPPRRRGRRP